MGEIKSFKDISYNKIKDFVPFFCDTPLRELSTKNSKKLVFILCDTVRRLAADVKQLKDEQKK